MCILITGEAGFFGSNFVLDWLAQSDEHVVNLDTLPELLAGLGSVLFMPLLRLAKQ